MKLMSISTTKRNRNEINHKSLFGRKKGKRPRWETGEAFCILGIRVCILNAEKFYRNAENSKI